MNFKEYMEFTKGMEFTKENAFKAAVEILFREYPEGKEDFEKNKNVREFSEFFFNAGYNTREIETSED